MKFMLGVKKYLMFTFQANILFLFLCFVSYVCIDGFLQITITLSLQGHFKPVYSDGTGLDCYEGCSIYFVHPLSVQAVFVSGMLFPQTFWLEVTKPSMGTGRWIFRQFTGRLYKGGGPVFVLLIPAKLQSGKPPGDIEYNATAGPDVLGAAIF